MIALQFASLVPIVGVAGLVSVIILLLGVCVSAFTRTYQFWPHGESDWTFWVGWSCWTIYIGSFLLVAYLDAGSLFSPGWFLFVIGVVLIVAGILISVIAVVQLGLVASTGVSAELYTGGVYRYSRNPQYLGFIAGILGVVIVSGSVYAHLLAVLGLLWFVLAPFAEEPWLKKQYGEEYEMYRQRTPRFIGLPKRSD